MAGDRRLPAHAGWSAGRDRARASRARPRDHGTRAALDPGGRAAVAGAAQGHRLRRALPGPSADHPPPPAARGAGRAADGADRGVQLAGPPDDLGRSRLDRGAARGAGRDRCGRADAWAGAGSAGRDAVRADRRRDAARDRGRTGALGGTARGHAPRGPRATARRACGRDRQARRAPGCGECPGDAGSRATRTRSTVRPRGWRCRDRGGRRAGDRPRAPTSDRDAAIGGAAARGGDGRCRNARPDAVGRRDTGAGCDQGRGGAAANGACGRPPRCGCAVRRGAGTASRGRRSGVGVPAGDRADRAVC